MSRRLKYTHEPVFDRKVYSLSVRNGHELVTSICCLLIAKSSSAEADKECNDMIQFRHYFNPRHRFMITSGILVQSNAMHSLNKQKIGSPNHFGADAAHS